MEQTNLDYLKDQIKRLGFGESFEKELIGKMKSQEPTFQLKQELQFGADAVEATLNFRKSDKNENYYFNSYEAAIKPDPENAKKPAPKQTFKLGRDNNFSLDEAYNLLSNRFVNKDLVTPKGEADNCWVKLNRKQTEPNGNYKMQYYNSKWNFNLEKALDAYPVIKETDAKLNNGADRAKLIAALKKGEHVEITLARKEGEQKGYVEANPYLRSVYVTDAENKKVYREANNQSEKVENNQAEKQGQKEKEGNKEKTAKQVKNDQSEGGPKNKNRNVRRRTQGVS